MVVRELITLLGFKLDDGPQKQYDKQIDRTKEKSNGLATAAKGVGIAWKVAAAAVAVGVGWISKNIIEATIEMEGYRSQLQAFTGDADSAAAALEELRDKTIDPLFGTGNLVNAYKQLRTVGMGAEETSRMIDVLGDCANGSAENFNSLNNILLRVKTTGKINDGTMRQLAMAGFGAQDMAQGLGISVERLNADLAAGKIGFNDLTRAMEGATKEGGRFYMNAANQALTLGGAIRILKSQIGSLGDAIGTKVAPALANLIGYISDLIKIGNSGLVDFGAKAFNYLIHVIAQVIIFFEVLNMRMKKYGGSFTALKGIFQDVFGFFQSVVKSVWPALLNLAQLILVAFKPIRAFVQPILEALKPIVQKVFGFISKVIERLIPIVDGLTPVFGRLGQFIGKLIGPVLAVAAAIRGVNAAIAIGKGVVAGVKAVQTAYALLTGTMSVMKAAADGNRLALFLLNAQMLKAKIQAIATAAALKIKAVASIIAAKAQAILNAIMSANPIGLIILAVAALIAAIILLVKNWDKVVAAFKKAFEAIGNFFKKIWEGIRSFFSKVVDFVKKNALNILNVILMILFFPAGVIMAVVRLIIKHWEKIKEFFGKVWDGIKNITGKAVNGIKNVAGKAWDGIKKGAGVAWKGIKNAAGKAWDGIKTGASATANFMKNRWEDIKAAGGRAFGFLDNISGGALSRMKDSFLNTINNIKEFFVGLWNALKEGPAATFEYIKNAFFGLFDNIKEKFLGFINVIKDGWDRVKGFFGGVRDAVVNVVTGGGNASAATPVNDMILTPEGGYSTHPDDYIMAMKKPQDLIDALLSKLGGPQLQPAYAGGGLMDSAMRGGGQRNYNSYSESNVTAPISVTVNASGMSPDMASAAVKRGVEDALKEAINGSRGTIPSPEARRN